MTFSQIEYREQVSKMVDFVIATYPKKVISIYLEVYGAMMQIYIINMSIKNN